MRTLTYYIAFNSQNSKTKKTGIIETVPSREISNATELYINSSKCAWVCHYLLLVSLFLSFGHSPTGRQINNLCCIRIPRLV